MIQKTLSKAVAIVITFVLIAVFLSQISVLDIFAILTKIDPVSLISGFILYVFTYILRSLRFHILLNGEVGIKDLFKIICVHNMANNILPARTGELSYVFLLSKLHNKTAGEGIVSLTVARVFDFITISLLFFISIFHIKYMINDVIHLIWYLILFLLILALLFASLLYYGTYFSVLLRDILVVLNLEENKLFVYILDTIKKIVTNFEELKYIKKIVVVRLILTSLGIWLSMYSFNYVLVNAMNIDFNFFLVIFATSFAIFSTVLPIQGIGGFGTLEGGWVLGFVAVGLTKDMAISSGFSYHIILWIYFLILGLWGLLMVKWSN